MMKNSHNLMIPCYHHLFYSMFPNTFSFVVMLVSFKARDSDSDGIRNQQMNAPSLIFQ